MKSSVPLLATADGVPEVTLLPILNFSCSKLFQSIYIQPFFFFQPLRKELLRPTSATPDVYYLGPMGDQDPLIFINEETN